MQIVDKKNQTLRSRSLPLALGTLIEFIGRVLRGDHPNLKDQVVTAGFDPGDGPPLEESPNPNPVELGNAAGDDLPRDAAAVGGEVVVRRERDLALVTETDEEVSGGFVDGVADDVDGEEPDREAVLVELRVGGGRRRRR